MPTTIPASARLNAGQNDGSMKSITAPPRARSSRLPSAPPRITPTGSHSHGVVDLSLKNTTSSVSAASVSTVTTAPPPENAPNATPVLRTLVRSRPKKTLTLSPRSIAWMAICLVSWSSARKTAAASAARRHAAAAVTAALARYKIHDDVADDRQHQPRHDRAEIERARPDAHHRDDAPEEVQVRVGHLAHEPQEQVEEAVVRDPRE